MRRKLSDLIDAGEEHHETLPLPSVAALVIVAAGICLGVIFIIWRTL